MAADQPAWVLCLASYFKGNAFLREARALGWKVALVTLESLLPKAWDRDACDEVFALPSFGDRRAVLHGISWLARNRNVGRICALDDFDVELAAYLREELRIPGMGETTARYFRDKLAMRARARDHHIRQPAFSPLVNDDDLRVFLSSSPGPWVVKPRHQASAVGIQRVDDPAAVWPVLDALGDDRTHHLIERMIPGEVFHVDALTSERLTVFARACRYRRPPLEVVQGGVFATRTLPASDRLHARLAEAARTVLQSFGMVRGASHTEFILSDTDGELHFLETGARVGGAHIVDLLEAASGLNLWREWARIELSPHGSYHLPPVRSDEGGLLLSLAREEVPDDSAFTDPEIVWRLRGHAHHLGLVVVSRDAERVGHLVDAYAARIAQDHGASLPPPSRPTS